MNTEFYRLIGSLKAVESFIASQDHQVMDGTHGPAKQVLPLKDLPPEVGEPLLVLQGVVNELLKEQAAISHAMFDFRRAMSRNAEAFYHAINKLRRKAPQWQIMDEDLLKLIEYYQETASSMFFGGEGTIGGVARSSSS